MITFIIPTIGRGSLAGTIDSLLGQSEPDWKAIVVYDGVAPTALSQDPRISIAQVSKTGGPKDDGNGRAGYVRNHGIKLAHTEWIGFVDDDDIIEPSYVRSLKDELLKEAHADVVIFRMKFEWGRVCPEPGSTCFKMGDVGISFCARRSLFTHDNFWFIQSEVEDFLLLEMLRGAGKRIVMSESIVYLVGAAR